MVGKSASVSELGVLRMDCERVESPGVMRARAHNSDELKVAYHSTEVTTPSGSDFPLLEVEIGNVSKYQYGPGQFALVIPNGSRNVVYGADGSLFAVFGDQQGGVRQSDIHAVP
jgi:hypothetical protein